MNCKRSIQNSKIIKCKEIQEEHTENKNVSFKKLKNEFINQTIHLEQDDIPSKLKELRRIFRVDINRLNTRDKRFIMEDDNWF